jgi:hypothetical protein
MKVDREGLPVAGTFATAVAILFAAAAAMAGLALLAAGLGGGYSHLAVWMFGVSGAGSITALILSISITRRFARQVRLRTSREATVFQWATAVSIVAACICAGLLVVAPNFAKDWLGGLVAVASALLFAWNSAARRSVSRAIPNRHGAHT